MFSIQEQCYWTLLSVYIQFFVVILNRTPTGMILDIVNSILFKTK